MSNRDAEFWREREARTAAALNDAAAALSYMVGVSKAHLGMWPNVELHNAREAAWDAVKQRDQEVMRQNRRERA